MSFINEARFTAYLKLIDVLLNCESGEEPQVLNINCDLVDAVLVEMMLKESANLIKQSKHSKSFDGYCETTARD